VRRNLHLGNEAVRHPRFSWSEHESPRSCDFLHVFRERYRAWFHKRSVDVDEGGSVDGSSLIRPSCVSVSPSEASDDRQLDALYEAHKPDAFLKLPHPSNYKLRALVDDGEVILRKLREWEAQRARPKAAQGGSGS